MVRELYIKVTGRVQGVGFRAYTQRHAVELQLKGLVRNMPDGSVEIIAQGSEDHLRCLLPFVHSGPRLAEIDNVEVLWRTATQSFSGFRTR